MAESSTVRRRKLDVADFGRDCAIVKDLSMISFSVRAASRER
jgi:hypothetical protein